MRESRLGFNTALAVFTVAVAVVIAYEYNLPLRDPDGNTGPTFIRLPVTVVAVLLADIVPRIGWRSWTRRGQRPQGIRTATIEVVKDRWKPANLRFTFLGLACWYATYAAVRDLKGFVPFVNSQLYDDNLRRIDRDIFFGHDPAVLLHQLLGTGWAAHVLSFSYCAWIAMLPMSLAIALVWIRRADVSAWWVTAVSIDWVLGVATNYLMPTLGPIYARPANFDTLPHTKVTTLQQSMWSDRLSVIADPAHAHAVQNIAAFASLHVGVAVTALVVARRAQFHAVFVWALRVFVLLTCLATVYFGWHYFCDVVAGAAIGVVGARLGEWATTSQTFTRIPTPEPAEKASTH